MQQVHQRPGLVGQPLALALAVAVHVRVAHGAHTSLALVMAPRLPLHHARRLALHAQGLAVPPPAGQSVSGVVARLGCLQLDPVGVVARSPLLVLRARLRGGTHDSHARALERAAYSDRTLFDYWCHEASLCHVDDLPLHKWAMRTYVERLTPARAHRARWLDENADFVEHLVDDLRERGPLRARDLEDRSAAAWEWGHWTDEVSSRQTIARMLDLLWMTGRVGIGARPGWSGCGTCSSAVSPAPSPSAWSRRVVRRAALRAVGMLGVARAPHITAHFTRRRYPGLPAALERLERDGLLERVGVEGLRGEWWARPEDLERAGRLERGSRTVALSPFDNLICDRARAESCSASTTGWRSTCRRPSAAGATTCCRSCTASASWAGPTCDPRTACCGCWPCTASPAGPRRRPSTARCDRWPAGAARAQLQFSFLSSSAVGTFASGLGCEKRRWLPNGSRMPQSMP